MHDTPPSTAMDPAPPGDRARASAPRLFYSMGVSVDGFIADRAGRFDWAPPDEELFGFHAQRVRELGAFLCGRRLYETMLGWETDPSMRDTQSGAEFADIWSALPKIVFSRTLRAVEGNARLAGAPLPVELAAAFGSTGRDVEIGGAGLAAQAIELGLIDELRLFRYPIVVGGGTPVLPPVTAAVPLELIATKVFDSGVAYEHYRTVNDGSTAPG